MIISGHKKIR